ncbi:MAG: ATP-binding protein [Thermoplasmata archaeon]|nr:ATP-binding protein [Thermoplasmata archaeon]
MEYRRRIADDILREKLQVFGAVLITGPKGCGKTTTAKQQSASFIEFQDEDRREQYLSVARTMPSKLLEGERPRLFDEWQDAPKIWGAIRKSVDDLQIPGQYILTGSTSKNADTAHTGTLRISRMSMYPMSLYESGESNGTVSLSELFEDPEGFEGCRSELDVDGIIHAICRGGWPYSLTQDDPGRSLLIAKDLFRQTCEVDISNVDDKKRSPMLTRLLLRSYSRNICQLADNRTIIADVNANAAFSESSYYDYVQALEKLHLISDVEAWCPAIRSKTAIRSGRKRNLADPSIAVAALGVGPKYFNTDFKTLGFLFESLCMRDLTVYLSRSGGHVSYYHDRYGLEADAVLHMEDGRYAICEIKLGQDEIDEGAKHLVEMERLIQQYNEDEKQMPLELPSLKIVITGTEYGYRRDDGVLVIPIACLRDRRARARYRATPGSVGDGWGLAPPAPEND